MGGILAGERRISQREPPALPQVRFYCRLEEQPNHLVPTHLLPGPMAFSAPNHGLVLHPRCQLSRPGQLPIELAGSAPLVENFDLGGPAAWVLSPGPNAWQAFCLSAELEIALVEISEGRSALLLPPRLRQLLAMAEILASEDCIRSESQSWEATIRSCATRMRREGYAPIRGLLHAFQIAALRRYYRCLIRTGRLRFGDGQNPLRYYAHNETVARFFHHQLTTTVSAIAGQAVKPSYAYFASYRAGAVLEKHRDRAQCEFSVSFCLDYSPEPVRETPWPLHLHTSTGKVSVFQAIGEGLVYRGCDLPHSRDQLPAGHSSTSIFFHYVPVDFAGDLN